MARNGRNEDDGTPPDEWKRCDDATLIAAMQRGWEAAYAEFFDRFAPMLMEMARRRRVPAQERRTLVTDFLDDAALRLGRAATYPLPRVLAGYLVQSFRRRLAMDARGDMRRHARHDRMAVGIADGTERAVAESCSQYAIRAAAGGFGDEVDDSPPAAQRADAERRRAFTAAMLARTTEEERLILGYLAERMPQREIAALIGTTHGALRVRISRLRERLRRTALEFVNGLPAEEGIGLARAMGAARRGNEGGANGTR